MSVKPILGKLEQSLNEFRKNASKGKGPEAELMNCMIDALPDAVYYKDLNSRYLIANHKTLEILGLSKEEIIGKHDYEIAPLRNHAEKNIYHDQIVFNSGKLTEVVEQVAMPDGKNAWFETIRVPRLDDAGKITGLVGFSRKVTRQIQAHKIQAAQLRLIKYAAHHTVKEFLQKFLDEAEILTDSKIGFYHFLEDDQKTLSLQAWSTNTRLNMCKASGSGLHYPVSEAGVWVDCIHDRKPVIHNHYESLPHKKGLPEGHAPVIRELVVPVFRKEKIVAILGVGNKRTDYDEDDVDTIQQLADLAWETVTHKRSEEEIRKLNETLEQRISERTAELENRTKQLQRLALELSGAEDRQRRNIASILHDDFQQQLAYIKMELDIVRKRVEKKIGQRLDTLAKLTAKCIKKSRNLSYGLNPPGLNGSGLLAAIDLLAKDMKQKQGLAVTVRTSPNAEPSSPALTSILFRSVRELLLNVSKHAGTDSAAIDIRCTKELIYLSVEDCGKGFDFNAVKSRLSCEAGFGLYSIEDRMSALGGSMQVITASGKGCRILLTVPKGVLSEVAVNEAALETSDRSLVRDTAERPIKTAFGKKQIRVLLADNHQLIRAALANLLESHQDLTIVGEAVNGREAVELAAQLMPHVVLMDVAMPELNGMEATAQIIRDYPDIPVIGLSMDNDEDARQQMLNAGASAYLCKTDSPEALVRSIRQVYQARSAQQYKPHCCISN